MTRVGNDKRRDPHYKPAMIAPSPARAAPRGFANVETWVFDLDNTLYPHHLNLWQQVDERIRSYIMEFLKLGREEAFRLQKDYYKRYGTSMRGLMTEHGMKADDFLNYVHAIDHSPLEPNPVLGAAIGRLPGRKPVLDHQAAQRRAVAAVIILLNAKCLVGRDLEKFPDEIPDALVDLVPEVAMMRVERVVEVEYPCVHMGEPAPFLRLS